MTRDELEAAVVSILVDYLDQTGDYAGAAAVLARSLVSCAAPSGMDLEDMARQILEASTRARALRVWRQRSGGGESC